MARGNRGMGYSDYAYALHHRHDSILFIKKANSDLRTAIRSSEVYENAREFFKQRQRLVQSVDKRNKTAKHVFTNIKSLGKTKNEVQYRLWCLENRLFLNHLNDLGTDINAAQDNLVLPAIIMPIGEGFHYEGLFNQIKQEFVSARYFYYEGVQSNKVHFSDKRVLLYNTLDYPSYSLAVEKVKAAFRIGYSLFDKIAFFLNRYLGLGLKEREVTFRTFWYESRLKDKGLRSEFLDRENWPLRGLFWLSKDLYEDNPGFKRTLESDAQELAEIRNHIEHKYLKVHEFGRPPAYNGDLSFLADSLASSVDRRELQQKVCAC